MSVVATPASTQPNPDHVLRLAAELNIKVYQVAATAQLFAEGATVPFIARYRKEVTGELDEVQVLAIRDRLEQMRAIDERRAAILASLKERNLLTPALEKSINAADTLAVLEDIYLPFRPKKRTRATIAKEKGLEPLAELLWAQDAATDALGAAQAYVGREYTADDGKNVVSKIASTDEALAGARDILAERISDDKDARAKLRAVYQKDAVISSKVLTGKDTSVEASKFKDYFEWSEPLAKAPSHRVLRAGPGFRPRVGLSVVGRLILDVLLLAGGVDHIDAKADPVPERCERRHRAFRQQAGHVFRSLQIQLPAPDLRIAGRPGGPDRHAQRKGGDGPCFFHRGSLPELAAFRAALALDDH